MHTRLPNGQIVYEEDYSCIVEPVNGKGGIYIGNLQAAQNIKTLRKHGIKAILTAAKGIDLTHPKNQIPYYLQVPGQDRQGFDLTRYFSQSINFIRDALDTTNIMVHCLAGVSRSVCLVLAYFIKCKGMTYEQAYTLAKAKRSIIHPNEGFIAQLKKFQVENRSTTSPSKYDNFQSRVQSFSASPTKRRYQYYNQPQISRANPQYRLELNNSNNYCVSPSKRHTIQERLTGQYQSPSKRYAGINPTVYYSPSKHKIADRPSYTNETNSYLQTKIYSKYQTYNQRTEVIQKQNLRNYSPERTKYQNTFHQIRGRSSSNLELKPGSINIENKRLFGNYDRMRHTSAAELSQELDSKIAAIRQKYSDYTKNQMGRGRKVGGYRQSQTRISSFLDENDIGLGSLALKKVTSEYQGAINKTNNDYGMIKNNLNKTINVGLGLKRFNSLREGY